MLPFSMQVVVSRETSSSSQVTDTLYGGSKGARITYLAAKWRSFMWLLQTYTMEYGSV